MSDFYRELLYLPEIGRRTSSVSTELEKEQVCKRFFWEKLHHTEYDPCMSSAITELEKKKSRSVKKKFEKKASHWEWRSHVLCKYWIR